MIQKFMQDLGRSGCYLICLLKIASCPMDQLVQKYLHFIKKGFITEDCFVLDPNKILAELESPLKIMDDRSNPQGKVQIAHLNYGHFIVYSPVFFDPLGRETKESATPKINGWRCFD